MAKVPLVPIDPGPTSSTLGPIPTTPPPTPPTPPPHSPPHKPPPPPPPPPPPTSVVVSSSVLSSASPALSASSSTPAAVVTTALAHPTTQAFTSSQNGGIVTLTSTIATTPEPFLTSSPSASASSNSGSFFHNTPAVAAVFSIGGIVAVAIFFICITNSIRRRRARKFDREVAEAAAVAAEARPPAFDDDIYATGRYSDNSHGTYAQSPMHADSYGMGEIHHYDVFAPATSGAAGVGVDTMRRARGPADMPMYDVGNVGPGAYGDRSSPYPAFLGPGIQQPYDTPHSIYPGSAGRAHDLLEAAGIGAAGAHIARGPSLHTQQTNHSNLSPSQSGGTHTLYSSGPNTKETFAGESYAAHYQPGFSAQAGGDDDDAYGGYVDTPGQPQPSLPNPYPPQEGSGSEVSETLDENTAVGMPNPRQDHSRTSLRDEEDYELERGKRVLKVANE